MSRWSARTQRGMRCGPQFMKRNCPKGSTARLRLDFRGRCRGPDRTPKGLIEALARFANDSQHISVGEVECPNPDCEKSFSIDKNGRVSSLRTIEAECPRPSCETIQNVETAGRVVCDGCGHKYTASMKMGISSIPARASGKSSARTRSARANSTRTHASEDEHFAGGYECPYCGHWHGHDEEDEKRMRTKMRMTAKIRGTTRRAKMPDQSQIRGLRSPAATHCSPTDLDRRRLGATQAIRR